MIIEYGSTKSLMLKTTLWHNMCSIYVYITNTQENSGKIRLIFKSGIVKTIFTTGEMSSLSHTKALSALSTTTRVLSFISI